MSEIDPTLDTPVFPSYIPLIDPSFFILQFTPFPSFVFSTLEEAPRLLPAEESTNRAISVLDHTPVTELHKIGVIYVKENQKSEIEILSNTNGSRQYTLFLCSMGKLFSLFQSKNIYTGGLDTSAELFDGPSALMFVQDQRMGQIIFHVTTMMPTRKEDITCTGKKRHIGNDYVNIVWNESGLNYRHDTIGGQFNFIVIVIEPLSDPNSCDYLSSMFRVKFSAKSDLPDQLKMDSSKLVMGSSLGSYVRQLAIQANMYCLIAASKDGYISNARERLQQIKRIKSRISPLGEGMALDFTKNL